MRSRILTLPLTLGLVAALVAWPSLLAATEIKRVATERPITKISTFKVGTLTVGQDGRRFAFAREADAGWSVEVDGKVEPTYKEPGDADGPQAHDLQLGQPAPRVRRPPG